MRREIQNRLEVLHQVVCAEIPASGPERRCFVGVFPSTRQPSTFTVRRFEVLRTVIARDDYVSPGELLESVSVQADGIEELESFLDGWGVLSDELTEPWKTDFPL